MIELFLYDFAFLFFYRSITETDLGTEELAHMEIVCAIVHQLTRNLSPEEIKAQGFEDYYVDHTVGIYPQSAGGVPATALVMQSKGDPITDLHEDMAAEQKARTTYDNILRLVHDPEICDPIRFLREREIVHFQRFGDAKLTDLSIYRDSFVNFTQILIIFVHCCFFEIHICYHIIIALYEKT